MANEPIGKAEVDELDGWDTIIGLEIHAQIKTGRKLFSRKLKQSPESMLVRLLTKWKRFALDSEPDVL